MSYNTVRLGIFVLIGVLLAASANAVTKNWATGDGNWSIGANWSPAGVPANTDDVNIVFADGVARTVTLDSTSSAQSLTSLTIDLTGSATNANTLAITGGTISDATATIGNNGNGGITQSGGTHTVGSNLVLANHVGAVGSYTLSGGTLNTSFSENIGALGTGTFSQTGGTNISNSDLTIGSTASSLGSYTLSGSSSLLQALYETIGLTATGNGTQSGGTFTQSNGSHQAALLNIGQDTGSTGSYTLSGGTLTDQIETIGYDGTGTFSQTGGAHSVMVLDLGYNPTSNGSYSISGGGLNANSITLGGNQSISGGTGSLVISGTGVVTTTFIEVYNTPGSGVVLQGGTLTTGLIDTQGVPGLFKWTSGTLNITTGLVLDPSAGAHTTSAIFGTNFNLSSGHTLNVAGDETIGGTGPFQLTTNGGTNNVSGDIFLKAGGTLFAFTNSPINYTNFNQMGGTITGTFTNNFNYIYQSGTFSGSFINNGTATFTATATVAQSVQNNGTLTVNAGQTLSSSGFTNNGSLVLAGGTLGNTGFITNSAGATITAHGVIGSIVQNHGKLVVDGPLNVSTSNDGIIEGAGIVSTSTPTSFGNLAGGIINATTPNGTLAFTNSIVNVAGGVINVGPTSTLSVVSTINTWSNSGVINLQGANSKLAGSPLNNSGTIQGSGFVNTLFGNGNTGIIRASGGELDFTGQGISNSATGTIQAVVGSSIVFLQGMSTNSGIISLTGGTFDNANHPLTNSGTINGYGTIRASSFSNSASKLLSVGEGNLDVFGAFTNNGVVNIQTGRSAYFYGTVNGGGSFTGGGTAVFLNSLSPGNSPALVTMSGSATLVGGTALAMELGGNTPGTQYDQLHVGGALSIGGILSVSLLNGFIPTVGSSFDLLDWGTLSGTFSSLSLPTINGRQWDTSQLYTTGVLSVIAGPLAGDYNNNGVVDAADYVAWRHGLGTTYTQTDYDVWRANFGNTAASGSGSATASSSAAVPEPCIAILSVIAATAMTLVRRRR